MKRAIVVDSASYLPRHVHERFSLYTVPLTVVVDGVEHVEFETIDAAIFYTALSRGAAVSTSQPPPGRFVDIYERAVRDGADEIVSVHMGSNVSGTINSARLAAPLVDIPVHLVDTKQASFVEGLAAWEIAEALADGEALNRAVERGLRAAATAGNVFIVGGTALLARGGRMESEQRESQLVPILALTESGVRPIAQATTREEAFDAMLDHLRDALARHEGKTFRIGIANGDAGEMADALEARVRDLAPGHEVIQYVIGPAVGAHTGPGCTGIVFLPRPV